MTTLNSKTQTPNWPDLAVDQTAWEMAKAAEGADACLSVIANRAQSIKLALLKRGEDDIEQARLAIAKPSLVSML
jgi:hypothetical protein